MNQEKQKYKDRCRIKRLTSVILVCFIATVLSACLVACDAREFPQSESGTAKLSLYLLETGDDGYTYAYFRAGESPDAFAYAECDYLLQESFNDIKGYAGRITYTFDTAALADVALTYAGTAGVAEGITRDNLKIVFVYVIMSESFTSNGEVTESDGYFRHTLTANPDDGHVAFVGEKIAYNTVAWYAMIIVSAVAVLAVIAVAVVLIGRRKWRKKTM